MAFASGAGIAATADPKYRAPFAPFAFDVAFTAGWSIEVFDVSLSVIG